MKKTVKKLMALVMAAAVTAAAFAGCSSAPASSAAGSTPESTATSTTEGDAPKVDISKEVKLVHYLWGSAGVANGDIAAEINKLAKEDINATVEFKYIDWGDVATKYPLLFASGEEFDITEASPAFVAPYQTLANQDAFADITDLLDSVPVLKAEIPEKNWNYTKVNGKIYGVPTLYVAFNAYGLTTRSDILEKSGLKEVNSFETAEKYFDTALKEGIVPLNGNSTLAPQLYRTFLATTGTWWHEVPGIGQGEMSLAAKSKDEYKDIFHPAFTDEFMAWAKKMKDWADKGYWTKDVMAAPKTDKDNFMAGTSSAWITHQPDWTGSYQAIAEKLPGITTSFWCYTLDNGKMKRMPPTENICSISSTSKNPERALMLIEKLMTDERYYRLMQMGIEGRQYEILDGVVSAPKSYDAEKDGGGFSAWSLRNDRLNLPYASEDPRRAQLNKEWDKIAVDDPYIGFAFDPKPVSAEISAISNVNATFGTQIMLGKSTKSVEEAVEEYRNQLTSAGVDKVIEAVKTQLDAFEASK